MLPHKLLFLWLVHALLSNAAVNVTLPNSSLVFDYIPFLCDVPPINSTSPTSACAGGWEQLESSAGTTVVTGGPSPQAGNIIPQMFVSFRASAVYLITGPSSNATANITLALTNQPSLTIPINASVGGAGVVNLNESSLTSLAVTFLAGTTFTQLAIKYVVLTVSDPNATSSFLPSPTLPPMYSPSISIQTVTSMPNSTAGAVPGQKHPSKKEIAEAFALVLGLGFGLTPIAAIFFFIWQRRRNAKRI